MSDVDTTCTHTNDVNHNDNYDYAKAHHSSHESSYISSHKSSYIHTN
jgi:hypothetical protein